jgi:hypothetical protein
VRDEIEATIRQLEREGSEATLRNDGAAWERLLADSWMNTNANGTVTTKPQLLELLRTRPFPFVSVEDDDVVIRVYPGAAVVTSRSTRISEGHDRTEIKRQVRFTRVYVQQDGCWRVAAAQATPIP